MHLSEKLTITLFCFQRKNGFVEKVEKEDTCHIHPPAIISLCFNERTHTSFFDRICTARGRPKYLIYCTKLSIYGLFTGESITILFVLFVKLILQEKYVADEFFVRDKANQIENNCGVFTRDKCCKYDCKYK